MHRPDGYYLLATLIALTAATAGHAAVESQNPDHPPEVTRGVAVESTDPDRPPAYGPETASVRIILFSDFQCSVCRRSRQATHQIAAEFPGKVRLEFWNHALAIHRNAEDAAAAALAAQRQGKFWEMHDLLFQNQDKLDAASLLSNAERLQLDIDRFEQDMADPQIRQRIRDEGALAESLGARGTPSFLINGKLTVGWASWGGLRKNVERELAAAEKLASEGKDPFEIHEIRAEENAEDPAAFELYHRGVILPSITSVD